MDTNKPTPTPVSRSVSTTATMVTMQGTNWLSPLCHICLNDDGFASLQPVCSRMDGKQVRGKRLIVCSMGITPGNSHIPCTSALCREPPAELALAEERTMTDVMGIPPSRPVVTLPIPCACNSRFVGELRLMGSILSIASILRSVSRLAMMAIVHATTQTSLLKICEKLGNVKSPRNSLNDCTTGIVTRCSLSRANDVPSNN